MNNQGKRRNAGCGGSSLPMLLFIIFLILKLTHVIDWSWWWVTSPLWIAAGLGILFLIIIGFILLLVLVGFIGASSAVAVGIKKWFGKYEQEEHFKTSEKNEI
ncbi:MAG: hypothetical protein ACFFDW_12750 [Candidatus Thorarchaeota archaeon]